MLGWTADPYYARYITYQSMYTKGDSHLIQTLEGHEHLTNRLATTDILPVPWETFGENAKKYWVTEERYVERMQAIRDESQRILDAWDTGEQIVVV